MPRTKNKKNEDESRPSNELLAAVKETRQAYKKGNMKSFKRVEDFISYLIRK